MPDPALPLFSFPSTSAPCVPMNLPTHTLHDGAASPCDIAAIVELDLHRLSPGPISAALAFPSIVRNA
ncbi:hypothetical protein PHLCEN_2v4141 [Hermanssonia centrifuga]|uniref:Uncharacterized protein n=1 Tax=Hermanssonia centrifuga TaxID=98765 RepID=A0A2R6PZ26_9APHY|nr:hypothetical protein PHLCEN_2v4141 [Hermanssonia centrifuga]